LRSIVYVCTSPAHMLPSAHSDDDSEQNVGAERHGR